MEHKDTRNGVKALILNANMVLVLYKPDGRHDLPGGRIEKGEGDKEGLAREIREETGMGEVAITDLFGRWKLQNRSGWVISGRTWVCQYRGGDVRLSAEHSGFAWEPVDRLRELDVYEKYGLETFDLHYLGEY